MKNLVINLFHIVLLHIILTGCASYNDPIAPVIAEVTAVTTPTNDSTPDYTFSSDEAGTITYGGSCSSSITPATSGNNTITFISLIDGTYSDCTIKVTDSAGNESNILTITTFTVSSSDDSSSDDSCPATNDSTLLAHYAFEGNLNDSSSYDRHLTEVGSNITYSAADNQSNKSGRAALFSGFHPGGHGSNTYAYTTDITLSDNFTVAFWTKPDSPNMVRWDSAFSTGDANTNGRFQIDYRNNQIRFSATTEAQLEADLNSNQWNHIVITKSDNSTDDKTVRMYTGGSLRDNESGVTTRWDKIKIGKSRTNNRYWSGYIDEVKIYNRALSAQEVLDLYECY